MRLWKDRRKGAIFGTSVTLLLPVGFTSWAVTVNPWFMDEPLFFIGLMLLPCALIGFIVGATLARAWFTRTLLTINLLGMSWIFLHPVSDDVEGVDLLVFGIDGATWDVIDKLDMPNISALQEMGSRAVLTSEEPMLSPLLWTTIATGRVPDEHGIQGFNTSADRIQVPRVWDIAAMEGKSVGLYKWLVTHPAETIEAGGFVVPAWLATETTTAPPELEIIKRIEFSNRLHRANRGDRVSNLEIPFLAIPQGLRFSTLRRAVQLWGGELYRESGPLKRARDLQLIRVWMDRDFYLAQLHRHAPNVTTFTTYATDALSHSHWGFMTQCHDRTTLEFYEDVEECPEWKQAVPEAYRQADTVLGEILDVIGWDTNVMILSDHGFRATSDEDLGSHFRPLTDFLEDRIDTLVGDVTVQRVGKKLIVSLEYVDIGGTPEQRSEALENQRAELEEYLSTLVRLSSRPSEYDPTIQEQVQEPLFITESIPNSSSTVGLTFNDENMSPERLAWDSVRDNRCWSEIAEESCTSNMTNYVEPTDPSAGEHDAAGIILVTGRDVEVEVREEPVRLIDVAPSILTLIGLPASDDMTGDAIWGNELIRVPGEEYLHLAPNQFMETIELDESVIEEQLEALGYQQ